VLGTVVLLATALIEPSAPAHGTPGTTAESVPGTTATGIRASVRPFDAPAVSLDSAQSSWQPGRAVITAVADQVHLPVAGTALLDVGEITSRAGPGTGEARVAGFRLLSHSTLGAGVIQTRCALSRSGITGGTAVVHLRVARQARNPGVNTAITMAGVATGTVDRQTATYDPDTGRLTWTIRGLDLKLRPGALGTLAGGRVVVAESTCAGTVTLDAVKTGSLAIVPGHTGTPTVTVTGAGDVAAPNTVITIPAPPAGYRLGKVTTTGGGKCKRSKTRIRCTGVTVPGSGSVTVSLPVTLAASGRPAANWSPRSGSITAVSTPIAALTRITIGAHGSGRLVTVDDAVAVAGPTSVLPAPAADRQRGEISLVTPRQSGVAADTPEPPGADAAATGAPASTHGVGDPPTPATRVPSAYSAAPPASGQGISGALVLTVMLAAGSIVAGIVARNRPRRRRAGIPPGPL